ncbi:unnamed protein product [Knipowitschia caucasica]
MELVSPAPLGSVTVGGAPWRDATVNSVRRAQRLVLETQPGPESPLRRAHTLVSLPEDPTPERSTANPGERAESGIDGRVRPKTSGDTVREKIYAIV